MASSKEAGFALRNHDRVAFYGDSITDNSAYCRDVEQFVVTRFPNLDVRYFNAGVGGDRVSGGWMGPVDQRLPRDLFSRRPTIVTIMLGMNDASYYKFDQGVLDAYEKGYQHIVDRLHAEAPGARVWLFRPSPFDDVTRPVIYAPEGYNNVLLRYADYVSDLAKKNQYGIVDQNAPLVDVVARINAVDHETAQQVIPDRIHPGWQGDYLMAEQLLKAWNAPALVSNVVIDGSSGAVEAANATVTDLQKSPALAWTETEAVLPFFIPRKDKIMNLILANSDLDQALNQETLTVRGLPGGSFKLRIDGKEVATLTADQLGSGVNLAGLDTPMFEQSAAVRDLVDKRAELWYQRWRQIDFNLQELKSSRVDAATRALDSLDEELSAREHKLAKTKPHRFELVPV